MIIGACGYGGTGSSAVKDFLKEFENVQTLDRAEAMFAYKVDGLQDLEYHLIKQFSRSISSNAAIRRFIDASKYASTPKLKKIYLNSKQFKKDTIKFIDKITQVEFYGIENYDYETKHCFLNFIKLIFKKIIVKNYEKIFDKNFKKWPMKKMYFSIKPENFYEAAKEYTNDILKNSGADFSKAIVLDQPFEGNNPTNSFPFFEEPYAIVVDRDPRDYYLASSYQWPDGQYLPRRNVEDFVKYYRTIRENIDYSKDTNKVLRINLEDLIFNYDYTKDKICNFLNFDKKNHKDQFKYFDPNRSIKGTQLYKKIKGHDDEIKYIEENLKEYLFDFDKYEMSKNNDSINSGFKWDKNV